MKRLAAWLVMLLVLSGGLAASAKDSDEKIYFAVRTESGMIIRQFGASDDRCMDVYGRTSDIEAIIPADGEPHRIAAVVRKSAKVKVHPPTYGSLADSPGVSSSAYIFVRGEQRFLECSIDTIYVLSSGRMLGER